MSEYTYDESKDKLEPSDIKIINPDSSIDIWQSPTTRKVDTLGRLIRANKELPGKIYRTMVELLDHDNAKIRVVAATFLADRGWGKPVQQIESDTLDLQPRTFLVRANGADEKE